LKAKSCWTSATFKDPDMFIKLHDPLVFADAFGMKRPQAFCAHEDCIYKKCDSCPAGNLKASCPNKSSLDYNGGCKWYYGKKYQYFVLRDAMSGECPISVMVTGRGTGKSAIVHTQSTVQDCTSEPYIRGMISKCNRPVPTLVPVVGNTKDTAVLLRNHIHHAIESNELINSEVADNNKTYIRFKNGSEIHILTAGVDGKNIRGFHADVIRNIERRPVKTTIRWKFDEAAFARAKRVVNEIMRPSLQVGNVFSGITITTTPGPEEGEIYDLYANPGDMVHTYNFSAFHNRYTNIRLLHDFRERMTKAGMASIYNREVLGMFQSDHTLFFPLFVWEKQIDETIDWLLYEDDIEPMNYTVQGRYYLGLDPNKFKQDEAGDFAAYDLIQVASDRSHVRGVSYGKYQMDLEDTFLDRILKLCEIFNPVVTVDINSGYYAKLGNLGIDVRAGKNGNADRYRSMSLYKLDIIDQIFKQPDSMDWEDERRTYIPKDPDPGSSVSTIAPKLDHMGGWGTGFTSDLLDARSYNYQSVIEDFGMDNYVDAAVATSSVSNDSRKIRPSKVNLDSVLRSSNKRFERLK
jgi:hypothetical protein